MSVSVKYSKFSLPHLSVLVSSYYSIFPSHTEICQCQVNTVKAHYHHVCVCQLVITDFFQQNNLLLPIYNRKFVL